MNRELLAFIDQIGRDKKIDTKRIISAIEAGLATATQKKYGSDNVQVHFGTETGEIEIIAIKKVVDIVTNPKTEISLQDASKMEESACLGDEIGTLIEAEGMGRISAQVAKQFILQRVREAEWESVHKEYSVRQGEMVSGLVLGPERRDYLVEIGKVEAILPYQEQVPRETFRRGDRIRAYLLAVKPSGAGPQIILSRTHPMFVQRLFENEVPEIAQEVVSIKGVVREPGDRTKIAVHSKDPAVDPVGACVGMRGSRVQAVVRELRGEKIDIIMWTEDPRSFIGEALSPAVIDKVGINEAERSAMVVVSDQQLSLAIGKKGQNVRLAAKLTGWKIDLINQTEYEGERAKEREKELGTDPLSEQASQEVPVSGAEGSSPSQDTVFQLEGENDSAPSPTLETVAAPSAGEAI